MASRSAPVHSAAISRSYICTIASQTGETVERAIVEVKYQTPLKLTLRQYSPLLLLDDVFSVYVDFDRRKEMDVRGEQLSISKMAALYGLTLRALRFYEDRGLLQPMRIGTGRFYTPKDRVRIELILKGKQLGFTLSEIETLILEPNQGTSIGIGSTDISAHLDAARITAQIAFLQRKRDQIAAAVEELRDALDRHEAETP